MGGTYQLYAALGNGSRRLSLKLGANLINNDYLGHMVFYGLNHHGMLHSRGGYLHPSGMANSWVGDIAVT
ncbi:unnamed protein product, partial [marine sediment metagenome]